MKNTSLKNVSVLCVDNYIESLELLKLCLELQGAEVYGAASMQEAIHLFSEHRPSILVADLALGKGDGISLLKEIRNRGSLAGAIAVTGISNPDVRQHVLDAGFDRYLVKPVDEHVLIQAVSALAVKGKKRSA